MKAKQSAEKAHGTVVYLRLPQQDLAVIDRVAKEQNRTRSAQIAFVLKQHIQAAQ